jgi:hypothetical protein
MKPNTLPRAFGWLLLAAFAVSLVFGFCPTGSLNGVLAASRSPEGQESSTASLSSGSTQLRSAETPVLLELFTSPDCASCQAADLMLARLEHEQPLSNVRVIVLREQVDPSENENTAEQALLSNPNRRLREYREFFHVDDMSLPRIVVNGAEQFDGSNVTEIKGSIQKAAAAESIPLQIVGAQIGGPPVLRPYSGFQLQSGMPATPGYVNVFAAALNPEDTTNPPAGAEEGQTPTRSQAVHAFSIVGSSWRTAALGKSPFYFPGDLREALGSRNGMRLVVFVQTKHIGPIQGVAFCDLGTGVAAPVEKTCPRQ